MPDRKCEPAREKGWRSGVTHRRNLRARLRPRTTACAKGHSRPEWSIAWRSLAFGGPTTIFAPVRDLTKAETAAADLTKDISGWQLGLRGPIGTADPQSRDFGNGLVDIEIVCTHCAEPIDFAPGNGGMRRNGSLAGSLIRGTVDGPAILRPTASLSSRSSKLPLSIKMIGTALEMTNIPSRAWSSLEVTNAQSSTFAASPAITGAPPITITQK